MAEAAPETKRAGSVKWFNTQKGYGFITVDDGSEEIFVHQTAIHAEGFRSLAESEPVEFNVEMSEDGRPKATGVTGPGGAFVQGSARRYGYKNNSAEGGAAGEGGATGGRGGKSRGRGGRGNRGRGGKDKAEGAAEGAPADGAAPAAPAGEAPAPAAPPAAA